MTFGTVPQPQRPPRVADELTWELVRDEWELLLAVGSGPTAPSAAAASLAECPRDVTARLALLERHGLVRQLDTGYGLVAAFYERREGMSSYLRDLVLRRLEQGGPPPVAGLVRTDLGDEERLAELLARAEESLYPAVVDTASQPEGPRSERFSIFFAASTRYERQAGAGGDPLISDLLGVLRAAARQRSEEPETRAAYLWIAEMRVDPEVADAIGDLFEQFLSATPPQGDPGVAAFAIVPSRQRPPTPRS